MFDVSIFSALLGGILTFLAPCTLPIIPAYIGFLAGGGATSNDKNRTSRIFVNALFFVLGFSLIFIFFGMISGVVGKFLILHRFFLAQLAGIFIIFFGLILLNIISLPSFFSGRTLPSWIIPGKPNSSFFLGTLFALGWSPCLGPVLGTILVLASTKGTVFYGGYLLAIYSLGLALPFLLVAYLYGTAFTYVLALEKYLSIINKIAGALFVFIGLLFLLGQFGLLNTLFSRLIPESLYTDLMNYM